MNDQHRASASHRTPQDPQPPVAVRGLGMQYGNHVIQRDLNFQVEAGDIFVIMGGSGCGKSTLLRHLIGLITPAAGDIYYSGQSLLQASPEQRRSLRRNWGISFQTGGLFSAMTLAENVALPLQQYTRYSRALIRDVVDYKLALVGLAGYREHYPAQISGGMRKRAALARAIALDPQILFFDEPSAGLDPVSSRRLDELILQLKESTGATVIMVTHELASIFAIANNGVFLDASTRTMIDSGHPLWLREHSSHPAVRQFLNRAAQAEGNE